MSDDSEILLLCVKTFIKLVFTARLSTSTLFHFFFIIP